MRPGVLRTARAALGLALALFAATGATAGLEEVAEFGSNPGNLRMFRYVPDGLAAGRPLVVLLHGCRQQASDYDEETGWVKYAEQWRFALLLPEQKSANNPRRCFNWFNGTQWWWWEWWEPGNDIDRDQGEALSIRQMIARMRADHGSDAQRIFVTGLSAGGGMTAVMLAAYPELFAGGAVIAGVPYKCALGAGEAVSICGVDLSGSGVVAIRNLSAADWAKRVREATKHAGPWPRVSIWQGMADRTVHPEAARELAEQWTAVHGIDAASPVEDRVRGVARKSWRDAAGATLVEVYTIEGMGHGAPVDPGPAEEQCGMARDFVLAAGICAPYHIGRFWGLDR